MALAQIDQRQRIESPEIDLNIYRALVNNKIASQAMGKRRTNQ